MKWLTLVFTLIITISCKEDDESPAPAPGGGGGGGITINYALNTPDCYSAVSNNAIITSGDIKIYRLTSSDGENWTRNPTTAVVEKGTSGA
jgi:hypothetical protein